MTKSKEKLVSISHIKILYDGQLTQLRVNTDEKIVSDYVECIRRGDSFPAVRLVQDDDKFFIVDGWHRIAAYKKAGEKKIKALILPPRPGHTALQTAIYLAAKENTKHGLHLAPEDKRKKAREVQSRLPEVATMGTRDAGKFMGVSHQVVAEERNKLARERLIPHPVLKIIAPDYIPDRYIVGGYTIREIFGERGGVTVFKEVVSYIGQLAAIIPDAWAYDSGEEEIVHSGLIEGEHYRFSVVDNPIVDGLPSLKELTHDTFERWMDDEIEENPRLSDGFDRKAQEVKLVAQAYRRAEANLKQYGKKDLIEAVETFKKYALIPGVSDDILTLITQGTNVNDEF